MFHAEALSCGRRMVSTVTAGSYAAGSVLNESPVGFQTRHGTEPQRDRKRSDVRTVKFLRSKSEISPTAT